MRLVPRLIYFLNRLRWQVTRPITLGVRVILVRDESVLLVKHTYQRHWYLPGGGVQRGETIEQAARREAMEEVGATLGTLQLFGVYTNFFEGKSDHVLAFVAPSWTLTGDTDREIERFGLFRFDELPDGMSPGTRRRIAEYIDDRDVPMIGMW